MFQITGVIGPVNRTKYCGTRDSRSAERDDQTMTAAEMVNFAYDQIDQARAELTAVSK